MAFTAREVIMVFRGQNYLSGAIRRVRSDVAGLSRMQQAQMQLGAAQVAQTRARLARQAGAAEAASLSMGGRRYEALQRRFQSNVTNIGHTQQQIARNSTQIARARESLEQRQFTRMMKANAFQLQANKLRQAESDLYSANDAKEMKRLKQIRDAEYTRFAVAERARDRAIAQEADAQQSLRTAVRQGPVYASQLQSQLSAKQGLVREQQAMNARVNSLNSDIMPNLLRQEAIQNIRLAQSKALVDSVKWERWASGARYVEHAAHVMQMFGLIATATMGYFAGAAAEFQTQATIAATQSTVLTDNTVSRVLKNAKVIQDAITNMLISGVTMAKPDELQKSIYDIFSGVTFTGNQTQQLQQGISLLKQFSQVVTANAGMVDMNEVTQAGITLINDFNYSVGQMPKALGIMQASVRFGRMTMSQFLGTFNQAAPAAKSAGYAFEDMATSITFLSRKFPSIRFAATGYARLVDILTRTRSKWKDQGIIITDTAGRLLPLEVIMQKIAGRFPAATRGAKSFAEVLKQVTGMSGTMQASRVATFFLQDAKGWATIRRQVMQAAGTELPKSLAAAEKSAGVTWAQFTNQLRALVLVIGQQALPAFAALAKPIKDFIDWFNKLDPHWKRIIGYWGTMISVGTLLGATLASVLGGIVALASSAIIFFKLKSAMRSVAADVALLANAQREVAATNLASEAGFVRVGTAMRFIPIMLLAALPLLWQYRDRISDVVDATGGLRAALIGLAGVLTMLSVGNFVRSFMAMSLVMKGLVGAAGIGALIAVFTNFAGAAEGLRRILDTMFSSWTGYVATIGVMTVAIVKLKNALIELGIVAKAGALISALRTAGVARAGAAATTTTGLAGIASGVAYGAAGQQYVRNAAGQFIGVTAASAGLRGAIAGVGTAVAGMLPMLAVGGALMGGLYLWKRHLDSVHDSAEKLRKQQEWLTRTMAQSGPIKNASQYVDKLNAMERAQITYNQANKTYQDALASGATGDQLKSLSLDLYDAAKALQTTRAALSQASGGFTEFFQASGRNQARIAGFKQNLQDLEWVRKNFPNLGYAPNIFRTPGAEVRLTDIQQRLGIKTFGDVERLIDNYTASLNLAQTTLDNAFKNFRAVVDQNISNLITRRSLPADAGRKQIRDLVFAWMQTLKTAPTIKQIQKFVKLAIMFTDDPALLKKYMAKYNYMMNLVKSIPPTPLTIPVPVNFLFTSPDGTPITGSALADIMNWATLTKKQKEAMAGPGWRPPNWKQSVVDTAKQTAAAVKRATKPWDAGMLADAVRIAREHQRAMQTNSTGDWKTYYKDLAAMEKKWKDVNGQVFSSLVDAQEEKLKTSAEKTKTITTQTFDDILSAAKNMYSSILSGQQSLFGQLGQGPVMTGGYMQNILQYGGKATAKDWLADIKGQIFQYRRFNNQLAQVAKRGGSPELLQAIQGMGMDQGSQFMKAMLGDPKTLQQYIRQYNRAQALIERMSMAALNRQLNRYRQYGRNIALQIIAGLRDENVGMETAIREMINKIFPGLPVGETGAGGKPTHKTPKNATKTAPGGNTTVQHNTTITVKADEKASLTAQLRAADFVWRNRRNTGPFTRAR